ncbi:MAG: DegT/DnrJ/EryC1/StrS family aminotransferase [Rhodospirillales bacterium]|jgi:CDP-4-dehydro-6-deoxyglucose reductase, E1|nr:DegT/DnrJ/EryC1/StrS family aminotransferase [Rhodospirillales bacterium]
MSETKFYPLAADTIGPEERAAIQQVVDSGYYTIGPKVAEFESNFADYHGLKSAVMVNSGSSANLIATASLFFRQKNSLKAGDEVIVPAISWATTYHPLQQYGLKMKVVDIDLQTLNMDIEQLEAALSPRTRMIVAVSILGNPANLTEIKAFADKHDLYLMEDNCESLDAETNGKKTGTFGLVNTSSFFFSHHISTIEGGMVATNDTETDHLLRALRAHGWTRDLPDESPLYQKRAGSDFFEAYRFLIPGYNVRSTEINAAIGIEQLKKLPSMTAARRKNLALFQELFSGDDRFIIQRENGTSSSFCFPIILDPNRHLDRTSIMAAMDAADIGYRIITGGNILRHDVVKYYDFEAVGNMNNANIAHDHGFFVGNQPFDLTQQLERLREVLDRACK